jgi:phage tail sheath protein FI
MGEYLRPDIYVERSSEGERPISLVGSSTGAFVGICPRGKIGEALLVTNWSEFIRKTALGLDTPFMATSDLAYAVYGFFQNGGSRAYISRAAHSTAAKATCKIPASTGLTFTALDEGDWANDLLDVDVVPYNTDAVKQVETATVIGTITGTGNATVTITAAGMTGSPKAISVAVNENDTATVVAGKIRTALNADSAVTALFTVGGTGANVVLTRKICAANDSTLNIAIANGTCTGLTAAPTSTDTTAGVAATSYTVKVTFNGELVETFEDVVSTTSAANYYDVAINGVSEYLTAELNATLVEGSATMAGGVNGVSDIVDNDFLTALTAFDGTEINLVAIPGQTSDAMLNGITAYCQGRADCFGILEVPMGKDTTEAKATVVGLTASDYGAVYYPWIKVVDPLSTVGRLRLTPPSGHIMGMIARTDKNRGVHKAPAGEEATLMGVVELETNLGNGDLEILNPVSCNSIIAKPRVGIVVWGARTLSTDAKRRYVSDVRFDIQIEVSCKGGTGWVVFEPNDELLWGRFSRSLEALLYGLWKNDKALKGTKKEEAYYVKCDAELNTQQAIDAGKVIAEIGYAKKRPAEFVILRIVQKSST